MTDELWITHVLNVALARPIELVLGWLRLNTPNSVVMRTFHLQPANAAAPIPDSVAMAILVAVLLALFGTWVGRSLSVADPKTRQQVVEVGWLGLEGHSEEVIGHGGKQFLNYLFTMALFILVGNLIGLVPGLESPTATESVTIGLALTVFVYYHQVGLKRHGALGYGKTFMGPFWWLSWLIGPLEIISHIARLMSLSVRLYANMYAGEIITTIFVALLPVAGVVFMGLHLFVALLQTYIFVVLAMVYLQGALAEEH